MLTEWLDQVPDEWKITTNDIPRLRQTPENTKMLSKSGPLTLCYYVVTILLHRNFILPDPDHPTLSIHSDSVQRCKEAAACVIDIECIILHIDSGKLAFFIIFFFYFPGKFSTQSQLHN
ncbi:hypothetical protein CLU79DRAFT_752884 [Phycomyces nitens]|nr:hypothetical protein CLU79DRAFT_752884 [Phycomyces nitens]